MNNTLIIVIISILIVGGGALVLLNENDTAEITGTPAPSVQTSGNTQEDGLDVPESFTGNLTQLFAFGKNITCTFTQNDEDVTGTGTIYVSGNRMRGDFVMNFNQGEGTLSASTIQKDNTIYSWGSSPFGDFSTKVAMQADDISDDSDGIDFDEDIDYNCKKWDVNNSMFVPPSDVQFDDINLEVNQINENTQQLLDLQCDACDNIPDAAAQAQCRVALGC